MTNLTRRVALSAPALILAASSIPAFAQGAPMQTSQAPGFYRYKVGDIVVTAINDGFAKRPLEGFVKNAELTDVKKQLDNSFMPRLGLDRYGERQFWTANVWHMDGEFQSSGF
jgi:hypothetical protein